MIRVADAVDDDLDGGGGEQQPEHMGEEMDEGLGISFASRRPGEA